MVKKKVPYFSFAFMDSQIESGIREAFERVYSSGRFILGEEVELFEKEFAEYHDCEYAIGCASGGDALTLSLMALGVQAGDEVILPAHTFTATAMAVARLGAKPVFCDVRADTCNIDSGVLEGLVNGSTKAIIPVHLYGQTADMPSIFHVSEKYGIPILEDNAQSIGGRWKKKMNGTLGAIGATSFYPSKNLGAMGDGGAITTNFQELNEQIRSLREYGSPEKYRHDKIGFNSRLDAMQAAFLRVKLPFLDEWNMMRVKAAQLYLQKLQGVGDIMFQKMDPDVLHVWHVFAIRTTYRDELQKHLAENEIGTVIHYPTPPHLQEAFSYLGHEAYDYPIAERISQTTLSLPLYPGIPEEDIEIVCEVIKSFFNQN